MKRIYAFIYALIISLGLLSAQVPDKISYQAVVRDASNKLLTNTQVGVQIVILTNSEYGTPVYRETHSVTTNSNGLMSFPIGNGTVGYGTFSDIDWSAGSYFVKVEIDLAGGTDYTISSTTQLLTVPYAMHAKTAENLTGTVEFEQITNVPTSVSFSGDYNDLENLPDLEAAVQQYGFSGNYNDLNRKPSIKDTVSKYGFSGSYEDLTEKPSLGDNGFTGAYADLSGKPSFNDSIRKYGFSGSYEDLTEKPSLGDNGFTGAYADLTGKPSFNDSIQKYGFSGNYADLDGAPSDFSGSYTDLNNKPSFKDSIQLYASSVSFNGSYNDLNDLPSIKDSVEFYSGDYNKLSNKPNIKDSIDRYGFSGSYNDLNDPPAIKDSIEQFGFSGDYNKLSNKPTIKDSIDQYGFSGYFEDLKEMPKGNQNGDMLYWNNNRWSVLRGGNDGEMLIMQDGELKWMHAAYIFRNLSKTVFDTITIAGYPLDNGVITDELNMFSDSILEVPRNNDAEILIKPDAGYGVYALYVDGQEVTIEERDRDGVVYHSFETITENHTISALFETRTIVALVDTSGGGTVYPSGEVKIGYAGSQTFTFTPESEHGISKVMLGSVDVTSEVLANQYTISDLTENDTLTVTFKEGVFAVGDIYYENSIPVGVVFEVTNGGENASIISLTEAENAMAWNDAVSYIASLTAGWVMPTISDLRALNNAKSLVNSALLTITNADALNFNSLYWTSTTYSYDEEYVYSFDFNTGGESVLEKISTLRIRAIRNVSK